MPVEHVPGFWDYLSQGFQKGTDIGLQERERQLGAAERQGRYKVQDAQTLIQNNQANAGLMAQLFNQGAVGADALQGSLATAGNPGINVMPSKAERRKAILAQGQGAVDALSDDEKEELGFKTVAQKKIEAGHVAGADLEVRKATDLTAFLNGDPLDDQRREIYGLMSNQDRVMKQIAQMDPYLGQLGERYVAGEIVNAGGKIKSGTAQQLGENAYAKFVSERAANGLGQLTPEQVTATRTYFQRAVQNALVAQGKMDLDRYQAESGRIAANASSDRASQSEGFKWAGVINQGKNSIDAQLKDLDKMNAMLVAVLSLPGSADSDFGKSPAAQAYLMKKKELEDKSDAYGAAFASLVNGQVPPNIQAVLQDAQSLLAGSINPPAGTMAPGAGGRASGAGGGATPPVANPKIDQAVQLLKTGKGTAAQLKDMVTQGRLTQAEYDEIIKKAGTGGSKQW